MQLPRPEHPRPDFYRPDWLSLNGTWDFEIFGTFPLDVEERYYPSSFSKTITVPFPYQSPLSEVGLRGIYPCVWYRRSFDLPEHWEGKRIILHFGAVDYHTRLWVNDMLVGEHRGGHVPFAFDITQYLKAQGNHLTVRVFDGLDLDQPRGKQSWADPVVCWYTQTTGIWQTVWLEALPETSIQSLRMFPDADTGRVRLLVRPDAPCQELDIQVEARFQGTLIGKTRRRAVYPLTTLELQLEETFAWTPETPHLYDMTVSLCEGETCIDRVESYTGLRKISLSRHTLLLNDEPYYQRLVLDQGFWPDGLYTAPDDEALKADIDWAKQMGFNGCRKHMKVEDPRFLYWADRLGFLVWGEFPANYEHSLSGEAKFLPEWQAALERDLNHPSIIAWTPFNESWGIKDVSTNPDTQRWVRDVVNQTRLIDPTRLVIDNDGWEHVEESDIYGYHDYAASGGDLLKNYQDFIARARQEQDAGSAGPLHQREMMVKGGRLPDMPIMITEFGGIGFVGEGGRSDAWGYANIPQTQAAFRQRYEETFHAMYSISDFCGYVYTQLTDVEQEVNGLLTAERQPKFDIAWLHQVNTGRQ